MIDLTPIQEAIRQAAGLCAAVQRDHLARNEKIGKEPVTIADYGSQAIICRVISRVFPDDAVLAEEQGGQFMAVVPGDQRAQIVELLAEVLGEQVSEGDVVRWLDHGRGQQAARTWVIDPVDGTKGFLALRHYAIAAGILEQSRLGGAVMAAPGYDDGQGALFYALDGKAYQQPLHGGPANVIHVSDRSQPADIRVVESVETEHASKSRMLRVRQLAGLDESRLYELDSMEKYALVASGEADLYLRLPKEHSTYAHKAWDHAAGAALVLAAGGRVTDLDGSPLDFSQGPLLPNLGMVVSNGHIHEQILSVVQTVLADGAG